MARPKITLYVDTVSPFAYVAYHILRVSCVPPHTCVWCLSDSHERHHPP